MSPQHTTGPPDATRARVAKPKRVPKSSLILEVLLGPGTIASTPLRASTPGLGLSMPADVTRTRGTPRQAGQPQRVQRMTQDELERESVRAAAGALSIGTEFAAPGVAKLLGAVVKPIVKPIAKRIAMAREAAAPRPPTVLRGPPRSHEAQSYIESMSELKQRMEQQLKARNARGFQVQRETLNRLDQLAERDHRLLQARLAKDDPGLFKAIKKDIANEEKNLGKGFEGVFDDLFGSDPKAGAAKQWLDREVVINAFKEGNLQDMLMRSLPGELPESMADVYALRPGELLEKLRETINPLPGDFPGPLSNVVKKNLSKENLKSLAAEVYLDRVVFPELYVDLAKGPTRPDLGFEAMLRSLLGLGPL